MPNATTPAEFPVLTMASRVEQTDADCPECKAAGRTNFGGRTPKLNVLLDGDGRTFCHVHGYTKA